MWFFLVIVFIVPIENPFINVTRHIIQTEIIYRETANRGGVTVTILKLFFFPTFITTTITKISSMGFSFITPCESQLLSYSRGPFPFGFSRKSLASLFTIFHCFIPSNTLHRQVRSFKLGRVLFHKTLIIFLSHFVDVKVVAA